MANIGSRESSKTMHSKLCLLKDFPEYCDSIIFFTKLLKYEFWHCKTLDGERHSKPTKRFLLNIFLRMVVIYRKLLQIVEGSILVLANMGSGEAF